MRLIRLLPVLCLSVPAGPALAQWAPLHGDEAPPAADAELEPEEEAERPRRGDRRAARTERRPARDRQGEGLGLSASVFGGYRGLGRTEGRGFDTALGHGLRLGLEPAPALAFEAAYSGGLRSGGSAGLGSRSRYHSLLLMAGWQHHEPQGIYGLGAGLAVTGVHVAHHWRDGEGLSAWGLSVGPAAQGTMQWRFGPVQVRVDSGVLWRGRQLDLSATVGLGIVRRAGPGG